MVHLFGYPVVTDVEVLKAAFALAETTMGLYKTECVRDGSPFRNGPICTLAGLEEATSAWVAWYNNERLMHRLGRRPPAEAEASYWARSEQVLHVAHREH